MENKKYRKMAIMYDFDKTLSPKYMQEFGLLDFLKKSPSDFFREMDKCQKENNMDMVLAYLFLILQKAKEANLKITRKLLNDMGKNVQFFPGVLSWFKRINKYGKRYNIQIEHYIISSGMKEIADGSKIAKNFKRIYASEYHYDQEGLADWVSLAVNYTNKTQFVFRINKGVLDICDDEGVNKYMPHEGRPIPYGNMIYFGDGLTDIPCMKLVKAKGGYSVAVYEEDTYIKAEELVFQNRVSFCAPANYSKYSELDMKIKETIREISKK